MWDRVIREAYLVDPLNHREGRGDIAIEDGRIAAVGPSLVEQARVEENAEGHLVMPGLVDAHLHLGSQFGSPYGSRMAALAGVTTCLDMAGPIDDIVAHAKTCGAGINVATIEGFDPIQHTGTMTPTPSQLRAWLHGTMAKGSIGAKIMGGHWPLPAETSRALVEVANDDHAYIAWHAGSMTAGSNLKGFREVIELVGDKRLHLAHINAYCRGRVLPVEDEVKEACQALVAHPNLWSEAYVSPNNGTILTCDEDGHVIDHVTQTCLATFGHAPTAAGMKDAILAHHCFVVQDDGFVSSLLEGDAALTYWEAHGTATAGSFPVNPALSRFALASAKRPEGSFVVDAISTDGGCIPRNVQLAVGLSLVKFGALTLPEFVQKVSLNPARHLRLMDRGHLSEGAVADLTIVDLNRQCALETIVSGHTVMKAGRVTGTGLRFITTAEGKAALRAQGFETLTVSFETPEPERLVL